MMRNARPCNAPETANDCERSYWYSTPTANCRVTTLPAPHACGFDVDHAQMYGIMQFMKDSQARLETEMKEKYRYKKKLQKAKTRVSNTGIQTSQNRIPVIVWIIPVVIVIIVFAVWVVWMILKIDGKTSVAQPAYYIATQNPSQPAYYVTQ